MVVKFDVHTVITDKIIAAIEQGAGTFKMPWHHSGIGHGLPVNAQTKKGYNGVNILTLWISGQTAGYDSELWASYNQWKTLGAQVRKGEKGTMIVLWKPLEIKDATAKNGKKDILMIRYSMVFNAAQVDGFVVPGTVVQTDQTARLATIDAFVAATGAKISHGGGRAFYQVMGDQIVMPDRDRFTGSDTSTATESYYATLLHELTHWSGAKDRCDRPLRNAHGTDAYAFEELVAELGSAFLCAELGITVEPRADHAQYLDGWLRVLKADKKAIFAAASLASKAVKFLHGAPVENGESYGK